ncbi:carbon-nitrogen hydrolase family protein [Aeromicrobium sp. A1-2]|uniref:carbon-nitrogen hydrolase family protein n=1 Tax=Aeromicrobium sp. A1-2 TaxID=2107713 RepID=UPI000E47596F|nr:carbon-nitrogen hydrolase family protein [Aeromicrobium sp. A1-2]AXT85107.1 carbon-nitrogen hydrolase family protein [Aeromicrobium sp. A1-2]
MTRVVAVQPALQIGDVEGNLHRCAELVRAAAREHSPEAIFLPEAITPPNAYDRRLRSVARPLMGAPLQTLRSLARELDCVVGGGFIAVRGDETRGTYALCEPDGAIHLHDKDQPSFWENNYYAGGSDDGVMKTSLGSIGVANGFEWGRVRTAKRLVGRVQLLAGGMHFPSFPTWPLTHKLFIERDEAILEQYCRETPPRMARMLGVPAVHASHVGPFTMETPLLPGVKWPSRMLGETTICDADGVVLERLSYGDGEGYVCADVTITEPAPRDPIPDLFWNAPLPVSVHLVWYAGNAHGVLKYRAMKALGLHSWSPSTDLPAYTPADVAPPIG